MKKKLKHVKPSVTVGYNDNILETLILLKKDLGVTLSNSQLESLVNIYLKNTGIRCEITEKVIIAPVKKLSWYKRCLNWIKNLFK